MNLNFEIKVLNDFGKLIDLITNKSNLRCFTIFCLFFINQLHKAISSLPTTCLLIRRKCLTGLAVNVVL